MTKFTALALLASETDDSRRSRGNGQGTRAPNGHKEGAIGYDSLDDPAKVNPGKPNPNLLLSRKHDQ